MKELEYYIEKSKNDNIKIKKLILEDYFIGITKFMSQYYVIEVPQLKSYEYTYEILYDFVASNIKIIKDFGRLLESIKKDIPNLIHFEQDEFMSYNDFYFCAIITYGDILDSFEYDEESQTEMLLVDSTNELLRMLEHEERCLKRRGKNWGKI